jgi:hypothetical protein
VSRSAIADVSSEALSSAAACDSANATRASRSAWLRASIERAAFLRSTNERCSS